MSADRHWLFSISAAQTIDVNPQGDDQTNGRTNAANNAIRSDPATIGTTVELVAVDSTKWLPIRVNSMWQEVD